VATLKKPEMSMDRILIVQDLIDVSAAKNYLEIGVRNGSCFLQIKCNYKMAVDPSFQIKRRHKLKYFFKNLPNLNNRYFEETSDDFFKSQQKLLLQKKPKIVLIDGLHTYEQSLRDVQNTLTYLEEGGVIVLHDCNPVSTAAASPADSIEEAKKLPGWSGIWNGDVWKTIVHLRWLNPELEVFVIDCDHGVGIVRKRPVKNKLSYSKQQIQDLSYKDLESDRVNLLNLKTEDFFREFLKQLN
jgi:hypothetical protein